MRTASSSKAARNSSSDITGLYSARYGLPKAGTKVYVQVNQVVDGWESLPKAFSAIVDGHVTIFISGLILAQYGTGPVKGGAVVHCLGILTSMFSGVFVSRGIVNLIYGGKKRLDKISIGQVWRPAALPAK